MATTTIEAVNLLNMRLVRFLVSASIEAKTGPAGHHDSLSARYEEIHADPDQVSFPASVDELVTAFLQALYQWLDGRTHIVWREVPRFIHTEAGLQITCRLTAYP